MIDWFSAREGQCRYWRNDSVMSVRTGPYEFDLSVSRRPVVSCRRGQAAMQKRFTRRAKAPYAVLQHGGDPALLSWTFPP